MVAQRAGGGQQGARGRDDTVATVVERTGGIPLFVEELTRAVLESVNAKLTGREILSVCEFCRVPEHIGGRGVRVRLWHVTDSEKGPRYHPPGSFALARSLRNLP
jgi:hypothetical protein